MPLKFSDLSFPPRFWESIAAGKQDRDKMHTVIESLTKDELEVFGNFFDFAVADLVQQVRVAGNASESDDLLEVMAGWVVSQGEDNFTAIFHDPTRFPKLSESENDLDNQYYRNNYYGMAQTFYEDKYRQPFPEYSQAMWDAAKRNDGNQIAGE